MSPKTEGPFFRRSIVAGVEHRRDPLFGSWTRINPARARRIKHTGGDGRDDDLRRLIASSRKNCPFCPERRETATPRFPPELFPAGRLSRNECLLFPNKDPYGEHHAVGILSDAHHIPMEAYREETIRDGLLLARDYFAAVHRKDPRARFPIYVWNFLPPSAGSIVHPHIQLLLESMPSPIIRELILRCREWRERRGEAFWTSLVREEERSGERMIFRDDRLVVLASFAPRGFREILLLLPGSRSLGELDEARVETLSRALVRLMRAYHAMGVGSFNLVTYSPPLGAGEEAPAFPFHAKIISRPYPSGIYTNDTGFFERMYDLWIIDTLPEETARLVRPFFDPS